MLKIHLFALAVVMASGTAFGQPNDLAEQLMVADEKQFAELFPKLKEQVDQGLPILISEIDRKLPPDADDDAKEKLAKQQANAAVVLLRINQPSKVWPLLKHSPDPRARSYLIHRLGPLGVDAKIIIKRLDEEPDISIRRALILSLGEFDEQGLSQEDRMALLPKLQGMYRTATDPGLHAATEWLLRQWKQEDWLKQINEEWAIDKDQREKRLKDIQQLLSKDKQKTPPQWYVNGQGQTVVVVPGPVEFVMGSPMTEAERRDNETQHNRRIQRNIALSSKEVTREQFLRFRKEHEHDKQFAPTDDCPVNDVSWYEAVAYCNWVSEQDGIPKHQWCYEPNEDGKYESGMTMAPHYLERTGYRLPTEGEWECACRASANTQYSFGESDKLLRQFAWFSENSSSVSNPVGLLKSNDLGLFDMHGNSWEWCQDVYGGYGDGKAANGRAENSVVKDKDHRVVRGGMFDDLSSNLRSARRLYYQPPFKYYYVGFRLARTLPPVPLTALPLSSKGGEIEKTSK